MLCCQLAMYIYTEYVCKGVIQLRKRLIISQNALHHITQSFLIIYTSHCPSRAWQIREYILVRAVKTCIHTHTLYGSCNLWDLLYARARTYTRVRGVTCGHL
jgi:hypothetical protein